MFRSCDDLQKGAGYRAGFHGGRQVELRRPCDDSLRIAAVIAAIASAFATANCRAESSSSWPEERVAGSFYCHADFALDRYSGLLDGMARMQHDLTSRLGIRPSSEKIHLFLFHDEAAYRAYVRRYFPQVPYRRALFIKDRGPGMVFAFRNPELEVDLRHESTHALLHAALPVVPLWLDEGLAEYFEVVASDRAYRNPHLSKIKWSIRFGRITRMEQLERIGALENMGQSEYRQAWAWVHFMLHGPVEGREELLQFLADLQAHAPPGVLSQKLRSRMPDLEQRFSEHFKQWGR